jgi:hypothetical protein
MNSKYHHIKLIYKTYCLQYQAIRVMDLKTHRMVPCRWNQPRLYTSIYHALRRIEGFEPTDTITVNGEPCFFYHHLFGVTPFSRVQNLMADEV